MTFSNAKCYILPLDYNNHMQWYRLAEEQKESCPLEKDAGRQPAGHEPAVSPGNQGGQSGHSGLH